MKVTLIVSIAVLAVALSAAAQPTSTPQRPALVSDTTVRADDSPLVRAAKIAVASRLGGSIVIDYVYMRRTTGHISEATGPALMPVNVGGAKTAAEHSSTFAAQSQPVDRAAVQQKIEALRQEQQRMHAETDEPYGGDVNEDQAERRMSEIPKEINKLQNPPPPRPPQ
jgi:hypothetical protein